MKYFIIIILALSFNSAIAEDSHQHHQDKGASSKLTLNKGKKWPTDKALRGNMRTIRGLIQANKEKIHGGKLSVAEYKKLGDGIEVAIKDTFKSCKLPAKADAQLHIILVDIMKGQTLFQDKDGDKKKGVGLIHNSLMNYAKFFDDPKWSSGK